MVRVPAVQESEPASVDIEIPILPELWRQRKSNLEWRTYPISLIEDNRWRAQRYGVSGELLDLSIGSLVPLSDLVEELCDLIVEDAQALDCETEIARLRKIVRDGTSADRQVQAFQGAIAAGARTHEALMAVVDQLIDETAAGAVPVLPVG
jgi:carboxylate-amine ligase